MLLNVLSLFGVALAALVVVIVTLRILDRLVFPGLDFEEALRRENLAVGVFLGALALGAFLLVGQVVA